MGTIKNEELNRGLQNIIDILETKRKEEGLTQEKFALKNEIKPSKYRNYLKKSSPTPLPLEILIKFAKLYHLDLNQLLGLERNSRERKITTITDLRSRSRFIPLIYLGMMGDYYEKLIQEFYKDETIKTFLLNERKPFLNKKIEKRKSFLQTLFSKYKHKPEMQNLIYGELIKYVAQLFSIDGRVDDSENFFFNKLKSINIGAGLKIDKEIIEDARDFLSQNEEKKKEVYLHKKSDPRLEEIFKDELVQKTIVWLMIISSFCDGEETEKERLYIEKVSDHLGLPRDDRDKIFDQVEKVLYGQKKAA